MRALILVDIQNDFLPGGALAVPDGDAVIEVANALVPAFELVVATQDFHPAHHRSFASQHPGRAPGDIVELNGLEQVLWPDHCVQGTPGADFSALLRAPAAKTFRKGTNPEIDSYSGFFDNGHRQATGLETFLRERRVDQLFVLGLATDYCVRFTVLDALKLGFATRLVVDGCRGVNLQPGDTDAALEEMTTAGASVVRSEELLQRVAASPVPAG